MIMWIVSRLLRIDRLHTRKWHPTGHEEIPVKLTVWIDAGVAPLVVALNDTIGIETWNSCEGSEAGDVPAMVYFAPHKSERSQIADFVRQVESVLSKAKVPHELEFLEDQLLALLKVPHESVEAAAAAIHQLPAWEVRNQRQAA